MGTSASVIAERLEAHFERCGFAEPGVDELRLAAGVSLRTLYKYFPSREAMVIGVLDRRHAIYLAWLRKGLSEAQGRAHIQQVFKNLTEWMSVKGSGGCLFAKALAAHPDSSGIRKTVTRHKTETRLLFVECASLAFPHIPSGRHATLGDSLFTLHEGIIAAAITLSLDQMRAAAQETLTALIEQTLNDMEESG